jgi:hypothetical protein
MCPSGYVGVVVAMACLAGVSASTPAMTTRSSALMDLLRSRSILISDGGLATELENRGGKS